MHIQKNSQKTIFEIGGGRKEGEIRGGKKKKKTHLVFGKISLES